MVTISFKSVDGDNTLVELVHLRFPDEESRANHEGGWANILDALSSVVPQ